jgi:hypothetical protein
MDRKRLLLISIVSTFLALTLSGFLFWYSKAQAQTETTSGIDLVLYPATPATGLFDTIRFDLVAFPNGHQMSAAEIHLEFDPTKLLPTQDNPVLPGNYLNQLFPNCDGLDPDSLPETCPATHTTTITTLTAYLGVTCDGEENGPVTCTFPPTDTPFTLATFEFIPVALDPGTITVNLISQDHPTLTAALEYELDATRQKIDGQITLSPCALPYDLDGSGTVDILDVMSAASTWNTHLTDPTYNPQVDLNRTGTIDITNIQTFANAWNQKCE